MANTHSIDLEAGSSQFLDIADVSQTGLDLTTDLSFEAWVKIESAVSMDILTKYEGAGNRSYVFRYDGSATTLNFFKSADGSSNDTAESVSADLGTGTWHHVAMTYNDTTGDVKFYVDGSQQGATQNTGTSGIFNGAASFAIGCIEPDTAPSSFFDGLIDEVRVWSDVRTATEISDNHEKELVGNEAGLVGYWKLNNDLLDETSNNNDLTNNGSAVFSTDVPFVGEEVAATPTPQLLTLGVG